MTTTTLPSANEDWGFFGTMQHGGADPMQSWNAASAMIAAATDASPEGVRDFLDSRHGRHFADDVAEPARRGRTPPPRRGDRGNGRPLAGVADRSPDLPRRGHPARASLPDRLGRPLRDPRRDAGLTSPLRRLAAHLRGYAASGS